MEDDEYESLPPTAGPAIHMVAGAAAGMLEHTAMYPFDVVKTRLQKVNPHPGGTYKGMAHCMSTMIRTEGTTSLFRGINAVLLGAGPAHALYFSVYERAKKAVHADGSKPAATASAAVCAAFAHDAFMNPVEVVKQRMQMFQSPYTSIFQCIKAVAVNEGIGAFYRSFTTQLLMNIPFQCTYLVTYESSRRYLNPTGQYNPTAHLLAGALAGATAAAITTPMDVAKTYLNTQELCKGAQASAELTHTSSRYLMGIVVAWRAIHAELGYAGFFRGVTARVIAATPAAAISWSVYEFFKHSLSLVKDA
ncbi:solute carrier protein [Salpingoeca rosetta]|uniref:Solute carrier protein n=1 Tax=Salpingoeca rosetta (strain ATCC 50818 / BSB-021) TaxID=946362 RepID=F2UM76_SALR5|nr:solute carrier protein [Salpingoeca rosetta]EGD78225.1 solute carrier protein [Salpingoeca rosetta]|eukprot:XP_004989548.1 solute carrier protein [Salpingoeca rosetta]